MTTVSFTKMHGIGNDFVVVDGVSTPVDEERLAAATPQMCHRHFGIGADGLILILPSRVADFRMRMFNPDGSEAEMCGNGTRCVARYVYDHGLTRSSTVSLETLAGIKEMKLVLEGGRVAGIQVDMGAPVLQRSLIPMQGPEVPEVVDEPLHVNGTEVRVTAVSMGNPHAVLFDAGVEMDTVRHLGPLIERHEAFPARTNVQFVQVVSRSEVVLRTWERGAGVTLACGTGACASVVAGAISGRTDRKATVHLLGGDLEVEWSETGSVLMTGPAEEVFEGEYRL